MRVVTLVPCGKEDNLSYLIYDADTKRGCVVDPSQCVDLVLAEVASRGVALSHLLTTHHHWDHAFGNARMAEAFPGLEVVGGDADEVEACTRRVNGGEEWQLSPGVTIRALSTRGHTDGHMSYTATPAAGGPGAVFTGDSLFIGGCGRVLEGTMEEMWGTLSDTLGGLPPDTKVYPGHDYTAKNYEFALAQEPDDPSIGARLEWAKGVRAAGGVTAPSTVAEEWRSNIFLRCANKSFEEKHGASSAAECFAKKRKVKDEKMEITEEVLKSFPGMVPGKFRKAQAQKGSAL